MQVPTSRATCESWFARMCKSCLDFCKARLRCNPLAQCNTHVAYVQLQVQAAGSHDGDMPAPRCAGARLRAVGVAIPGQPAGLDRAAGARWQVAARLSFALQKAVLQHFTARSMTHCKILLEALQNVVLRCLGVLHAQAPGGFPDCDAGAAVAGRGCGAEAAHAAMHLPGVPPHTRQHRAGRRQKGHDSHLGL